MGYIAGYREPVAPRMMTERLILRPWHVDDAGDALAAYGHAEVARWLVPTMDKVGDEGAMRLVLQQWVAEDARMSAPAGRWAIERAEDGRLIGGATLLPLPPDEEFEVGWQLTRMRGAAVMPPRPGWRWRNGHLGRV